MTPFVTYRYNVDRTRNLPTMAPHWTTILYVATLMDRFLTENEFSLIQEVMMGWKYGSESKMTVNTRCRRVIKEGDSQPAIKVIKVNRPHSRPPSGMANSAIKQGRDQASPKKQCLRRKSPNLVRDWQFYRKHSPSPFLEVIGRVTEQQHGYGADALVLCWRARKATH